MMAKRRWSTQELKEVLGEPSAIGRHGEASGPAHVLKIKLEPGEQPGRMQWNCVGGNPRDQLIKAFFDIRASIASHSLYRVDVQQIMANYLGCTACVDPGDPNLWVMEGVCDKHRPVLGEGSDSRV